MKSHVQVAVIGGGVVGCSVLYHLTKAGWKDVVLIERSELTSGSTWHAAGGFHTLNGDPNVAKLQAYTVGLYKEIEEISGQSCGLHLTGGLQLADTPERLDWLKMAHARGRYLGMETEIISAAEAKEHPAADRREPLRRRDVGSDRGPSRSLRHDACLRQVRAHRRRGDLPAQPRHRARSRTPTARGTWSPRRARSRPSTSSMPAGCGRARSAAWSGWSCRCSRWSTTTSSPRTCRRSPRSTATTGKEIVHAIDFGGEIYTRQERGGMLLGTYEKAATPWSPRETPWDFGQDLLTPDLDRIAPSLEIGFKHFPALQHTGIKQGRQRPLHLLARRQPAGRAGARACSNFWCACAVMAGFSQGGGVGLALANWMMDGDPGLRRLGHGRRALRRLGDDRLHQRQGARELFAPLPHPLPERGAAGGAADADDAALRPDDRAGRGDGRLAGGWRRRSGSRRRASSRRTSSPSTAPTISST